MTLDQKVKRYRQRLREIGLKGLARWDWLFMPVSHEYLEARQISAGTDHEIRVHLAYIQQASI